jgi:hypothetical protein
MVESYNSEKLCVVDKKMLAVDTKLIAVVKR